MSIGSLFGVGILGTIQTLITFDGTLSSWWTRIVIGALLCAFCLLQRLIERHARGAVGLAGRLRSRPWTANAFIRHAMRRRPIPAPGRMRWAACRRLEGRPAIWPDAVVALLRCSRIKRVSVVDDGGRFSARWLRYVGATWC